VRQPLQDHFWGDRIGSVTDPYGHVWSMATRKETVPPDEIERRGQEWWDQQTAARRN
jgi:PhnB protein